MREMIEQLENDKVAENEGAATVLPEGGAVRDDVVRQLKKKSLKKLKEKEIDIKTKDKQIEELKDEAHRGRQVETLLDSRLREANETLHETEDRLKYLCQKLKEVELERDLVLAEKNNAINENDVTAQHIQAELNSLRECFAKLKVERDNLLFDMENTSTREREWRLTVERLSEEVKKLESQIGGRERDQGSQLRQAESKNQALLSDLKYLKTENERMKEQHRTINAQLAAQEQAMHSTDLKRQEAVYASDELKRIVNESRLVIKKQEVEISGL